MTSGHKILETLDQVPDIFVNAFKYWETQRGSSWAPAWSDFKLQSMPFELLPWSVVVDVQADTNDFQYRFWGTRRTELIGKDMTGKTASGIPNPYMRDQNIEEYVEVCAQQKPMLFATPAVKESGVGVVFESIRLPLSDDGTTVTKIYSAMNYNAIMSDHYEIYDTNPGSI